jgi:hypothetical protein
MRHIGGDVRNSPARAEMLFKSLTITHAGIAQDIDGSFVAVVLMRIGRPSGGTYDLQNGFSALLRLLRVTGRGSLSIGVTARASRMVRQSLEAAASGGAVSPRGRRRSSPSHRQGRTDRYRL